MTGLNFYVNTGIFVEITIVDGYTKKGITEDGKLYSLSPQSLWKNAGSMKVRRYLRAGMKFKAEIVRQQESEGYSGIVTIRDEDKKK